MNQDDGASKSDGTCSKSHTLHQNVAESFLFQVKPLHFLTFGSIPMVLGAYAGYRIEINQMNQKTYNPGFTSTGTGLLSRVLKEEMKLSNSINMDQKGLNAKISVEAASKNLSKDIHSMTFNPARLAFAALGIGSLLSIGGVSMLTVAIFKASGSDNLEDLLNKWKDWTPKKRKQLEEYFGVKPKSLQHEDVQATQHMTEDEEWEFIKKKYIPELLNPTDKPDTE